MRVEIGGEAVAHRDEALHVLLAQAVDLAQAKPQRAGAAITSFVMPA
ncbi:MAG TPA: hypothetical protein VF340_08635 [Methyloceanibacter sp.]